MKLFLAEVRYEFVVAAESEIAAIKIAQHSMREVVSNRDSEECDVISEITKDHELPFGWDGDCLAYAGAGSDDIKIGDVLEAIANTPTPDAKTIDMFEVAP